MQISPSDLSLLGQQGNMPVAIAAGHGPDYGARHWHSWSLDFNPGENHEKKFASDVMALSSVLAVIVSLGVSPVAAQADSSVSACRHYHLRGAELDGNANQVEFGFDDKDSKGNSLVITSLADGPEQQIDIKVNGKVCHPKGLDSIMYGVSAVSEIRNDKDGKNLVQKIMIVEQGLATYVGGIHTIDITGGKCGAYTVERGHFALDARDTENFVRTEYSADSDGPDAKEKLTLNYSFDASCKLKLMTGYRDIRK